MSESQHAAPVTGNERIQSIDTLRGFALLGIFVMNITGMAFPFAAYFDPTVYGGMGAFDYGAWVFAHLFFDLKMMGIFSMLFGAGLILMADRAEAAGRGAAAVHYRRTFWLLIIGLVHAYLIWPGDILVTYALCGFVLFLFRKRSIRALLIWGVLILTFGALIMTGGGFAFTQLRDSVERIEASRSAGEEISAEREQLVAQWQSMQSEWRPSEEQNAELIATMRGSVGEVVSEVARESLGMHLQAVPFNLIWRALGLMLIGMALMKAGVFAAQRSVRFYRTWLVVGVVVGLPVIAYGIEQWERSDFDFVARFLYVGHFNYFASILVSLAYVSCIMLLAKSGALAGLRARLAAVGRMALTNYLMQSLIAVTLFYGYGFGLFGSLSRAEHWWVILGVWTFQLVVSPWWLARFRFGPAEWLWRSLTYWRRQPLKRTG